MDPDFNPLKDDDDCDVRHFVDGNIDYIPPGSNYPTTPHHLFQLFFTVVM